MLTLKYCVKSLELSVDALKAASMLNKPKIAEHCVNDALACIRSITEMQSKQVAALIDLNNRLTALEKKAG